MTAQSSPTVTAETLSGVEIFGEVTAAGRAEIARDCHGHRYHAGDEIISYRDDSTDVYFIVSGSVRATTAGAVSVSWTVSRAIVAA